MKATSVKPTRRGDRARKPVPVVHLEYVNPNARSVCVAGTFNEWHPGVTEMLHVGDGRWLKDLALQPGRYEYRLVVDGEWVADPQCPDTVPNPFNGLNSVLLVRPEHMPGAGCQVSGDPDTSHLTPGALNKRQTSTPSRL